MHTTTKLRRLLDRTIGMLDSEADLTSGVDDRVAMFVARVYVTDDIQPAHLRRVHRIIQKLLVEEFGLEDFDDDGATH